MDKGTVFYRKWLTAVFQVPKAALWVRFSGQQREPMWTVVQVGGLHRLWNSSRRLWWVLVLFEKESQQVSTTTGKETSRVLLSESLSLCCALTRPITSDRSMAHCQSRGKRASNVCMCMCVWARAYMFPGLSGSSLRGCDTNPYKASIMERKVATSDVDDIQKVRHLTVQDSGVLSSPHQQLIQRVSLSWIVQQTWLKMKEFLLGRLKKTSLVF